jgi:hypothetical protein
MQVRLRSKADVAAISDVLSRYNTVTHARSRGADVHVLGKRAVIVADHDAVPGEQVAHVASAAAMGDLKTMNDAAGERQQRRANCAAEVYGVLRLSEEVRQCAALALRAQILCAAAQWESVAVRRVKGVWRGVP